MVEVDGIKRWRDGILFAVRKNGKGMGDLLIEAMQSRGLMFDFNYDSQYGLIVSPRQFIATEPHRVSIAMNGIIHTMGASVARQLVQKDIEATEERVMEELGKLVKSENAKLAAGKQSLFSKVVVQDFAFTDGKPRKGLFIVSDVTLDGLYRVGVLADEYEFLGNGEYEVSCVAMNGKQLVIVLK
jgi:hypothetical protein